MDVKKFNFYTNNINVLTAKARFEYLDEKKKKSRSCHSGTTESTPTGKCDLSVCLAHSPLPMVPFLLRPVHLDGVPLGPGPLWTMGRRREAIAA